MKEKDVRGKQPKIRRQVDEIDKLHNLRIADVLTKGAIVIIFLANNLGFFISGLRSFRKCII